MTQPQAKYRYQIDFAVEGDLRFLGHLDMVQLLVRAALRARLPLWYTQGFNPRPRLSILMPRPVGEASQAERLEFELTEPVDPPQIIARWQEQLPAGVVLRQIQPVVDKQRCQPAKVVYRVETAGEDSAAVKQQAATLLAQSRIDVLRPNRKTGRDRPIDLRPFVASIEVDPSGIEMTLRVIQGRMAKPAELLTALGLAADQLRHRVRRMEVEWQTIQPKKTAAERPVANGPLADGEPKR